MAAGIVIDRFVEPCETEAWIRLALAFTRRSRGVHDSPLSWIFAVAFLAGLAAIGGGWHHFRWSDLAADDLARTVTETPEPACRSAAWCVKRLVYAGTRVSAPELAKRRTLPAGSVLDLTESSDGTQWQRASGFSAMVIVAGDLSEIQAGQRVEAAGHLARDRVAAQSRRILTTGHFCALQGIRLRLTVDEPASLWRDQRGRDRNGGSGSLLGRIQRLEPLYN